MASEFRKEKKTGSFSGFEIHENQANVSRIDTAVDHDEIIPDVLQRSSVCGDEFCLRVLRLSLAASFCIGQLCAKMIDAFFILHDFDAGDDGNIVQMTFAEGCEAEDKHERNKWKDNIMTDSHRSSSPCL